VVQAVDKKRARLNCIDHLLRQFPYAETPQQSNLISTILPDREQHPVPDDMLVPEIY
jgi:polyphosphate kinase